MTEPSSREAVEAAEGYADGRQRKAALARASAAAHRAGKSLVGRPGAEAGAAYAAWDAARPNIKASAKTAVRRAMWAASYRPWTAGPVSGFGVNSDDLRQQALAMVALIQDVFGNPFRPGPSAARAVSPTARSLADAAYDLRTVPTGYLDNARLAVLSDALEEAGCTDADLLSHLRSPGPHARGCWAVDLLLGKK
jgi:hypothetical protein